MESGNWAGGAAPQVGDDDDSLVFPSNATRTDMVDDIPGLAPQSINFEASYSLAIDAGTGPSQGQELIVEGSFANSGTLTLPTTATGTGALFLNNGGPVQNTGQIVVAGIIKSGMSSRVPSGVKVVKGGNLQVLNNAGMTPASSLEDDGTLDVADNLDTESLSGTGKVTLEGAINVGSSTASNPSGTVTVDPDGTIAPGSDSASGPLTIDGSVSFSSGSKLAINLASSNPSGGYDQLDLDDTSDSLSFPVALNGANLMLNLSSSTAPGNYSIVQAKSVTGQFSNLPAGAQTIDGMMVDVAYTSTAVNLTVLASTPTPTTTTLVTSASTPFGAPVPLVAIVKPTGSGATSPSGEVAFYDNQQMIAMAPVANNVALAFVNLPQSAGQVANLEAVFMGSQGYSGSIGTAGLPIAKATSSAHLVASPITSKHKTTGASLVATVSPQYVGVPTGQVTLYSNGKKVKSANLSGGSATFKLSLSATLGKTFTILYSGDVDFNGASSTKVVIGKKSFNSPVKSLSLHPSKRR